MLRTDNVPKFLGAEFTEWCKTPEVVIDYIEPGKPNQNAYIERFNRSYRTEVLSVYLFSSLDEVREITWRWMLEYNEERGHDALGKMTPLEFYNNVVVSLLNCPLDGEAYVCTWHSARPFWRQMVYQTIAMSRQCKKPHFL